LAAFLVGVVYSVRLRRHEAVLFALVSVLSPFAVFLLVNRFGYFFNTRQILFALPSFLLIVAAGIAAAGNLLGSLAKRFASRDLRAGSAWAIALLVFVPLNAADVHHYYRDHRGVPDWKHAVEYLETNVGHDDLVVSMKAFDGAFCMKYYARPELHERIVDVRDLIEWHGRWTSSRGGNAVPSTVWFVCRSMPKVDPAEFSVVSFPHLRVVRRNEPVENWQDFWAVVPDHVATAARATGYYRGPVLSELSTMLTALGRNESAYETVRNLARQFPDRVSYQKQLGAVAVKVGELTVAENAFRATLEIDPKSYAFSELAGLLRGTGRTDEAVEVVKKAVTAKDEPYRRIWLAMMYDEDGKDDLAEETFRSVTAMQPDYPYAHFRFGQFCAAHGRLDEAVAEYRTVLELDPTNNVFNFLANVLLGMGKRDEAIEVVRRAVAVKDEPYRRVCLGMVYSASGKHDLGEQEFLRAVEMQPGYEYAHYRLGQFYAMHGRRDEAVAEFETVLRLNPGPERVEAVQAQLEKLAARESAAN
jgi:tetratricopeptide (TPR) repeat protein